MKLHKFRSYRQYRRVQIKKNKNAIDRNYAIPEVMEAVAVYVKENLPNATFGICHGAKNGLEVNALRDRLEINVIGTDISPTAKKFDHMIQWDFHEVKDEWRGRTDFIYSNTLDHSIDPVMCLDRWAETLRDGGLCILEWSPWHGEGHSTPDDPFGASLEEYRKLLSKNFQVRDVIELGISYTDTYNLARTLVIAEKSNSSTRPPAPGHADS